ncbi:MAG: diacylglycerol kinase family lipid kinase [Bacilli bacterium]|nr:diacylglycerol kinase family lipid kinase [Bacilli bacterium]
MKKCYLIYNPNSGREKSKEIVNDVKKMLEENSYSVIIKYTEYKGHAREIIKLIDDCDLVIAAGGDGTFNEVISGNIERSNKLLISHLPIGTTNDVGTMYGYGKNYLTNLKLLLDGVVKNVDVCLINNRPFIYVAGYGNFMDIPYSTPRNLKRKYGRIGYFIHAIKTMPGKLKFSNIKYKIDGKEYDGRYSFIFITNSTRVAGVDGIYQDVKLDDNKFEVLLCNIKSKAEIIKDLILIKNKDIINLNGFEYFRTDNFEIEFEDALGSSWCLDGEEYSTINNSFKFSVNKDCKILLPKKNIEKLFVD